MLCGVHGGAVRPSCTSHSARGLPPPIRPAPLRSGSVPGPALRVLCSGTPHAPDNAKVARSAAQTHQSVSALFAGSQAGVHIDRDCKISAMACFFFCPARAPLYLQSTSFFSVCPSASTSPPRLASPSRRPRRALLHASSAPSSLPIPTQGRVLHERAVTVGSASVALTVAHAGGRRRLIYGGVDIEAPVRRVWHVLTRYGLMHQYMPNITRSDLAVRKEDGALLLDQTGIISRKLGLQSRVLLQVREDPVERIRFSRLEGRDFSYFEGVYNFTEMGDDAMRLDYELDAVPMPLFPVALVERKIVKEVPGMLAAVREEALYGRVVPFE